MKWKIHAPHWDRENQKIKWRGIYGDSHYMTGDISADRIMLAYPETADHFYYLWKNGFNRDIIFATYSVKEMRRFIKQIQAKPYVKKYGLYVYDAPRKKYIEGDEFIKRFIRE